MYCSICGLFCGAGNHRCPARAIEALDMADVEAWQADELEEAKEGGESFAERLQTGVELLALAGD